MLKNMVGFSYVAVLLLCEATNLLTTPRTYHISIFQIKNFEVHHVSSHLQAAAYH